ncbi:MAG: isoprenyl transferase [Flavobacteriaceae bacterium]|nr:isoprenyl transferase [Flavobacteriaceae bacterium]MDG2314285.1 isoprenyl transferase [Flavobacteriaceae bacterium]
MSLKSNIRKSDLPKHIAIIMDGNGRWAKQQGLRRVLGHQNGTKAVRETMEGAAELGVKHLTLYAFSTENWKRPKLEIDTLMKLLVSSLKKELSTLVKNNIRLSAIGNLQALPPKANKELHEVMDKTATHTGLTLTLALSYGAREEIVKAVKDISEKVKNNIISLENLDETIINEHLYTQNLPEVDLLIRTSGECRVSNFLLWQIAYAELYFTPVLWPEFNKEDLFKAIVNYQQRERRFGKTSEQLQ